MSGAQHNLNIKNYSLEELFGLFDLNVGGRIYPDDLKQAKRKVLMLHPDKSRLPPEYFLFYKKALDVIYQYYQQDNRENQVVGEEPIDYKPSTESEGTKNAVQKTIEKMSAKGFHNKFNELFEETMAKKPDASKNAWFTQETPQFQMEKNISASKMGAALEDIKQKQSSSMIVHGGIQTMTSAANLGTNLYDEDGDADAGNYISSDPFSKLKFEDLRKVHKDQTVFQVSERDYKNVPKYSSVDHFVRERNTNMSEPLAKEKATQLLERQEREMKERILRKEHEAKLRCMEYKEKNKSVLSRFLFLGNG